MHGFHIFFALFDVTAGHLLRRNTLFDRFRYDLIIHIGKIGDKIHFISSVFHIPAGGIEDNHGSGISYMNQIVNGRTAYIHLHLSLFQRNKFFFFLRKRIIKFHCFSPFLFLFSAGSASLFPVPAPGSPARCSPAAMS